MKKRIFSAIIVMTVALALIIVSCGKSTYNSTPNNPTLPPNTVGLQGMVFGPVTLTVTAGTTVTWDNNDNMAHTVTADDNTFDSGNIAVGTKFTKTFNTPGSFPYHCTYHANMKATIIVTP